MPCPSKSSCVAFLVSFRGDPPEEPLSALRVALSSSPARGGVPLGVKSPLREAGVGASSMACAQACVGTIKCGTLRGVVARGVAGCDGAPFLVLLSGVAPSRVAVSRSFLRAAVDDRFEGAGIFLGEARGL